MTERQTGTEHAGNKNMIMCIQCIYYYCYLYY